MSRKIMKTILVAALSMMVLISAQAEELNWFTSLPKAQEKAKTEKKMVLLDFTGSDWCGWCIKLDKEVFSTPEFAKYAKENLALVQVDFPRKKKLPADLKKANQELQEKYQIQGYPTIIVLNSEGKKVGQLGYMPGGPTAFIAALDKLKNK